MSKDTIYRQDAIDALDCISGVEEVLRSLPSAQLESDKKQLSRLIRAGCKRIVPEVRNGGWNFRPNCGADMREDGAE